MSGGVLVTSMLERYLCGLPFGRVEAVEDAPAAGAIDLSLVWGVRVTGGAPRRAVTVRTTLGSRRLLLGEMTRVRSVPRGSLAPLPPFLEGIADRAAIDGVFFVDQRLGYVIDVDRLCLRAPGGPQEGGSSGE